MIDTIDVPASRHANPELERHRYSCQSVATGSSTLTAAKILRKCEITKLNGTEFIKTWNDVILMGVVRSDFKKQMAEETVRPIHVSRQLINKVVVMPTTTSEALAAAPRRIIIATGNADLSRGCADRLQANGHAVECVVSGLDLLAALEACVPDVLVVADLLPWGGTDGVLTRIGELGLLPRVKVIHVGLSQSLTRLPVEFRDQLAAVIDGNDCTADLVVKAVEGC